MWRWTGFNSGLDLIVTYDSFKLTLKVTLDDNEDDLELAIISGLFGTEIKCISPIVLFIAQHCLRP